MSSDDQVFKKVSVKVGLVFIHRLYNPMIKYLKAIKKADKTTIKECHDFLFTYKHIVAQKDYFGLTRFRTKSLFFNAIITDSVNLYDKYCYVYGSRTYDVFIVIINKVIDKYNKYFK